MKNIIIFILAVMIVVILWRYVAALFAFAVIAVSVYALYLGRMPGKKE
jgi:hypothetical protein